jgi:hypothetical protein
MLSAPPPLHRHAVANTMLLLLLLLCVCVCVAPPAHVHRSTGTCAWRPWWSRTRWTGGCMALT